MLAEESVSTLVLVEMAVFAAGHLLTLALLPRVILARRDSAATLSWILALAFLPWLGAILYFFFGEAHMRRTARHRRSARSKLPGGYREARERRFGGKPLSPTAESFIRLLNKLAESPPIEGNSVRVFVDPDQASEAMHRAVRNAKVAVHFLVYIFKKDEAGTLFRNLLAETAARGVKVRLLVDGVGTLTTPNSFFEPIRKAGGEVATFLPVTLRRGLWHANLRNHRKVLVVDGRIGFTGGLNVGNEYGGLRRRQFGPWRDTHVEVNGPGVASLQDVFVDDWHFATGSEIEVADAFPDCAPAGEEIVQVVSSGPDSEWEAIHHAIFAAINAATQHVYITAAYFVPDRSMLVALQTAAMRGVDVRILLPDRNNHPLVRASSRYHYLELLRAGVRIYEYHRAMLHAKTVEVDGRWATVGSANLDLRSFRLNFELNVATFGPVVAGELKRIFLTDLESSKEISVEVVEKWTLRQRFGYASARLVEGLL